MVFASLVDGLPFTLLILCFDLIVLDHTQRESKGGLVMAVGIEEDSGGIQTVWVSFDKLTVQIAVHDQTEAIYMRRCIKCIGDCFISLAEITVIFTPDSAVKAVNYIGAVTVIAAT